MLSHHLCFDDGCEIEEGADEMASGDREGDEDADERLIQLWGLFDQILDASATEYPQIAGELSALGERFKTMTEQQHGTDITLVRGQSRGVTIMRESSTRLVRDRTWKLLPSVAPGRTLIFLNQ